MMSLAHFRTHSDDLAHASRCSSIAALEARSWDVVVIGAGPAGGMAAATLAESGARVLLVDKSPFPRGKVCGCYLNPTAVATLASAGLAGILQECGARPVTSMDWRIGRTAARFPLAGGAALSRAALDTALAREATRRGAIFLSHTRARLAGGDGDRRLIELCDGERTSRVRAAVVIAADGVAGRCLDDEPGFEASVSTAPRIGIGTTIRQYPAAYEAGTIYMACAAQGYLGLLRVEGEALPIAAAVDPAWLKEVGGPARAAAALLAGAGLPSIPALDAADWKGTPALTRQRAKRAGERLLVVGDAAGYVEPFTGEGIGWALAGGAAAAEIALQGIQRWQPTLESDWNHWYRDTLVPHQRRCRLVTGLLRRPALTALGVGLLSVIPAALRAIVRRLQAPVPSSARPTRSHQAIGPAGASV